MIDKKLKSITIKTAVAGAVTFRGYDGTIDYNTQANAQRDATLADTSGYDLFVINLEVGTVKYLFDGSDTRVNLLNKTEIILPQSMGMQKPTSAKIYFNNNMTEVHIK